MRRLVIAGLAALVLAPAAGAAPGFSYGVAAGEITATSAVLWARSNEPGAVRLRVWNSARQGMPTVQLDLTRKRARDLVVQRRVTRSAAEPPLLVRLLGAVPARAESSVPASSGPRPWPCDPQTIRFAISGDADGTIDPKTGKPAYNVFQVYGRMAAERNHFNINLGDTIYSDSEVGGVPPALTVPREVGEVPAATSRSGICATCAAAPGSTATGTTTSSSTTSRARSTASAIFARRRVSPSRTTHRSRTRPRRALPHVPLGQAPRALLPRRALVPLGEGEDGLRERSGTDRAAGGAHRVRGARSRARQPRCAGLPGGHQRSRPDDARRPPVRGVHTRDPRLDRDLEGDRERGADPAVLRPAVRPLGGLRGRAEQAAPVPAGERRRTSSSWRPTRTRTSSTRCG